MIFLHPIDFNYTMFTLRVPSLEYLVGCATLMYHYLLGLNEKEKHKYICTTSHVINSSFQISVIVCFIRGVIVH